MDDRDHITVGTLNMTVEEFVIVIRARLRDWLNQTDDKLFQCAERFGKGIPPLPALVASLLLEMDAREIVMSGTLDQDDKRALEFVAANWPGGAEQAKEDPDGDKT